jgi:DNA mismatch repair ATPase MutS
MQGHPQLAFITGSNMAGKSTFLRTIGTNLVLAMAGAPVCASQFETPVVRVMTSMRIADNLEESASTFYAELQKLKMVLDAVKEPDQRVFLLLDEILRGTNSLDRHTGSEALIRQLIKEEAVGMIASHDLSLTQLQQGYPGIIHNYHFDVTIEGSELNFDYKLKQGVCKTLNATLLMKKIGIEL